MIYHKICLFFLYIFKSVFLTSEFMYNVYNVNFIADEEHKMRQAFSSILLFFLFNYVIYFSFFTIYLNKPLKTKQFRLFDCVVIYIFSPYIFTKSKNLLSLRNVMLPPTSCNTVNFFRHSFHICMIVSYHSNGIPKEF